jgi:hypothetical protein
LQQSFMPEGDAATVFRYEGVTVGTVAARKTEILPDFAAGRPPEVAPPLFAI